MHAMNAVWGFSIHLSVCLSIVKKYWENLINVGINDQNTFHCNVYLTKYV